MLLLCPSCPRTAVQRTRSRNLPACGLLLGRSLLLAGDGAARPTLRARIGARALATDGQTAPVADPAVAVDLDQPLDVLADFAAEVAFDRVLLVDELADAVHLFVGKVARLRRRIHLRDGNDAARGRAADAVDVAQRDVDALVARDVDSGDACHVFLLALPMLVLRDLADDADDAIALDDLALVAALLHGSSDPHVMSLSEPICNAPTREVVWR